MCSSVQVFKCSSVASRLPFCLRVMASCNLSAWNYDGQVLSSRAARRRVRVRRTAVLHAQKNTWDLCYTVPFLNPYGQASDDAHGPLLQADAVLSFLRADAPVFSPEVCKHHEESTLHCERHFKNVETSTLMIASAEPETSRAVLAPWLFLDRLELGRISATCSSNRSLVNEFTPFCLFADPCNTDDADCTPMETSYANTLDSHANVTVMKPHVMNIVRDASGEVFTESQTLDDSEPIALDGEWEIIENQLQVCLKSIRGFFPQMYRQLLDTEGVTSDEGKTGQMASDRRRQAIETLTAQVVAGLQASLPSSRSREVFDHFSAKIFIEVDRGVNNMFEFAESLDSPDAAPVIEISSSSRMQGITKLGMTQPHMEDAALPDVPRAVAPRNDEDIQGRLPRDVLQALQQFLGSVVPMLRKIYLAAVADEQKHTGHPRLLQLSPGRKQHVINNLVTEIEKVAVAQFQKKADVFGLTEAPFKADGGLLRTQIQQFVATAVQHEEDKILQLAY